YQPHIVTVSSSTNPHPQPSSTLFPYTTLFRSPFSRTSPTISRFADRPRTKPCTRTPSHTFHRSGRTTKIPTSTRTITSFISSTRSEEHTSELQSRENLVCRLLLEIKNNIESNT